MEEVWKDIDDFPGYQVSSEGRVRSYWRKKHVDKGYGTYRELTDTPYILPTSDDGNGYRKLMIRNSKNEPKAKKVHRLVAETFIPHSPEEDTVDHIKPGIAGKLDNSVSNLRWISRRENIQKAYSDGVNDERIRKSMKPVMVRDLFTGTERYFESLKDVSKEFEVDQSTVSHSIKDYTKLKGRYLLEFAGREERLLYGDNEEYQCFSWV